MKRLSILGIPTDLGANIIGARYAPNRIRKYLLPALKEKKIKYTDFGDVSVPSRGKLKNPTEKYLGKIAETCFNLGKQRKCFSEKYFPVVLGGDHTITSCYINEIAKGRKIGIIYFDAHGDYNTPETTPSGNVHGMVLTAVQKGSHLLGSAGSIKQKNIVMVSTRNLDRAEKILLQKSKITIFTDKDVRKKGIEKVMKKAASIAGRGTHGFHLSVDLDSVDPRYAPGVSTPVKGGLTKEEILEAMELVPSDKVLSADFVEVNPKKDKNDKTSKLVAEMILRLIG